MKPPPPLKDSPVHRHSFQSPIAVEKGPGMGVISGPLGGRGLVNRDISRYLQRAVAGNPQFQKYCDAQRAPRVCVTDIMTLRHNSGWVGGGVAEFC